MMSLIILLALAPLAHGQDLFVFPNDGQSQDQQDMDEFQCQRSARDRTGFDPMATPRATTAAPRQEGGVVSGAARGSLLDGAIGAATGNTRQGLRTGAAGGDVMGGMRRADSNRQRDDWARRETQNYQRNRDNWNRAFIACMEARGYTVRQEAMNMTTAIKTFALAALMSVSTTAAADSFFDGKRPLLCSMHQLSECDAPDACSAMTPEQIGAFSHLDIDFKNKLITRPGGESQQQSTIDSVEAIDGKLIMSGIEDGEPDVRDGAGWTISIMDPEGTMVMAVAGDGFAVVGLGACVPKP